MPASPLLRLAILGCCLISVCFSVAGEAIPAVLWIIAAGIWRRG